VRVPGGETEAVFHDNHAAITGMVIGGTTMPSAVTCTGAP
jgi:hypothetical protein